MKKKKAIHQKVTSQLHSRRTAQKNNVSYQRIIIITSSLVVLFFTFVAINRHTVSQSVAGLSITKGFYNQATVSWQPIQGAVAYNLYYKESSDQKFTHAVRRIPANITSYTVSYLKKNTTYQYRIFALDATGKEFSFSSILFMNNVMSM